MNFKLEITGERHPKVMHPDQLADALRKVANRVQSGQGSGTVSDMHHNVVGMFRIED